MGLNEYRKYTNKELVPKVCNSKKNNWDKKAETKRENKKIITYYSPLFGQKFEL